MRLGKNHEPRSALVGACGWERKKTPEAQDARPPRRRLGGTSQFAPEIVDLVYDIGPGVQGHPRDDAEDQVDDILNDPVGPSPSAGQPWPGLL